MGTYKITNEQNNLIDENIMLGQAFSIIDKWCQDNKRVYGLGNIYHMYDNQIGVDIFEDGVVIEQFVIKSE